MPFPTVSAYNKIEVLLRSAVPATLQAVEVLNFTGEGMGLNYAPLKPFGSNEQNVKGDGSHTIGNIMLSVLLNFSASDRPTALDALFDNLVLTASLRYVAVERTYDREIASFLGIRSWSPIGTKDLKVDVEFAPTTIFWTSGGTNYLGVL
jgi:hypothetical protein